MANTYSSLHYHVVFSTKNRERLIAQEIEGRVWAYIGGIARKHRMNASGWRNRGPYSCSGNGAGRSVAK